MKSILSAAALLAAIVVAEKRDLCSEGSVDVNGNYYCQEVNAITYTGVGGSGSYNKVTDMASDGTCSSSASSYSGSLAPLDEEVSMHFRGPLKLKQFAVYTPSSSSKKRSTRQSEHARRHARGHAHGHQHHERDAAVGDIVTATINGVVETWTNSYTGASSTSAAASSVASSSAASSSAAAATYTASVSVVQKAVASSSASSSSSSSAASSSSTSSSGGWSREAFYDSESKTSEGLVFLNHQGGTGSGVFDYVYGNSLSYSSADGLSGVSESTVFEDTTLPSDEEIVIMSDTICDGDCGYYRPGTVAYHGFGGSSKAFYFEFEMPDDGQTAASEYVPLNMPAIWMLNALIPRTLQYGTEDCSCWQSGCGEFDIFEVLAAGDKRMKSTLHGNIAGGDSDYFARPETSPQKAVMILDNDNIYITYLDNSTTFGSTTVTTDVIDDIISGQTSQSSSVSLFALSS